MHMPQLAGERPTYWSDRFSVVLVNQPEQELQRIEQEIRLLSGVESVHGRKRFLEVLVQEARLTEVMKLVEGVTGVEKVELSAIRYTL